MFNFIANDLYSFIRVQFSWSDTYPEMNKFVVTFISLIETTEAVYWGRQLAVCSPHVDPPKYFSDPPEYLTKIL